VETLNRYRGGGEQVQVGSILRRAAVIGEWLQTEARRIAANAAKLPSLLRKP
jgi:hypothetical protein